MSETGRLSERDWKLVVRSMPIPCVDVIIQKKSKILMGFRTIRPYRGFWALPGGRILKHEHPEDSVRRTAKETGLLVKNVNLVGVFPVRFPRHPQKRYDITLCYKSQLEAGSPQANSELTKLQWVSPRRLPERTGHNYRKMIEKAFPRR